jgi:hypothetical protein
MCASRPETALKNHVKRVDISFLKMPLRNAGLVCDQTRETPEIVNTLHCSDCARQEFNALGWVGISSINVEDTITIEEHREPSRLLGISDCARASAAGTPMSRKNPS